MKINIEFCEKCGYRSFYEKIKSNIIKEYNGKIIVEESYGLPGTFEVNIDGTLIYSKILTGKIPENSEIISLINSYKSGNSINQYNSYKCNIS